MNHVHSVLDDAVQFRSLTFLLHLKTDSVVCLLYDDIIIIIDSLNYSNKRKTCTSEGCIGFARKSAVQVQELDERWIQFIRINKKITSLYFSFLFLSFYSILHCNAQHSVPSQLFIAKHIFCASWLHGDDGDDYRKIEDRYKTMQPVRTCRSIYLFDLIFLEFNQLAIFVTVFRIAKFRFLQRMYWK